MGKRFSIGLNLALGTALVWALWGALPATGGRIMQTNYAAPAFVQRGYSTHNDGTPVCGTQVDPAPTNNMSNGENLGDLDNAAGSYLANVRLPQGTTVRRINLFVNDADMDNDVHAYLVRKRIDANLDPNFAGYRVMGHARSTGAVTNVMRRFSDTSIKAARIDNGDFYYFLELVHCDGPEPYAVQIVHGS